MTPLRVREKQIRDLNEEDLVDLLDLLLVLESQEHGIPLSGVGVSLRTKVPDGGLDGTVRWTPPPKGTEFLPKANIGFQCKATKITKAACANEVVDSQGQLKPGVEKLLKSGGAYILFTSGSGGDKWNSDREGAIRSKFIQVNAPKAKAVMVGVYGADRIRKWVDRHLAAVVFVSSVTGHPIFPGLKTWKEKWRAMDSKWNYFPDAKAESLATLIRSELSSPRKCLRLNGLSGLGKTRLVMEALKPRMDADPMTASVIYLDAQHQPSAIANYLSEWKRLGRDGVLVVDNCVRGLHEAIQEEVLDPGSAFSAITIGLNPDERISGAHMLELERAEEPHIVRLVQKQVPGINDSDAAKIAHWAGGFPFFGLLLCEAWVTNTGLGKVQFDDSRLSHHLWGDSSAPHADQEEVIKVCSLFESIEIGDGNTAEAQFVVSFSGVALREVRKTLRAFERRGTIERYGDYVRLRPHPLALRLCAEWWRTADKSLVTELLNTVPESMLDALCQRLGTLDFLEEAREVTKEICRAQGPFGDAEVLSSERGARILRALTEINPEACSKALARTVRAFTSEALKERELPRRQWVWTLELLIFRRSTYREGIQTLQRLAAAETEKFSNNATGIWSQSFHVYLPGTEASLQDRLQYLSTYLEVQNEDDFPRELFLGAIDKALEATHFSRTSGAEDQGSGPTLKDYAPSHGKEILGYWNRILDLGFEAVAQKRLDQDELLRVLGAKLRGLLRSAATEHVERIVATAAEWSQTPWTNGIEALRDTLRFDARGVGPLGDLVRQLLAKLEPDTTDVAGRLVTVVSRPSWTDLHEEGPAGSLIEVGEKRAEALGEELGPQLASWEPLLVDLFKGEQRMAWAFGVGLARKVPKAETFLAVAMKALRSVPIDDATPILLGGFLSQIAVTSRPVADAAIQTVLDDNQLRRFGPRLLAGMKPSGPQLSRLLNLVLAKNLPVSSLSIFGYGRALDHLRPEEVASFASSIYGHSAEGSETAFFLLYMFVFGKPDNWAAVRPTMRQFILAGNLSSLEKPSTSTLHEWGNVCVKLVEEGDPEVAESVARQIVAIAENKGEWRYDFPRKVAISLLSKYGKQCWPIFAEALLGPRNRGWSRLAQYLGHEGRHDETDDRGPIDYLDPEILRSWLRANPKSADAVAGLFVLVRSEDTGLVWTPIATWLLENASDKDVLSAITRNLLTGSWSGSREPYLKQLQSLLLTLASHKRKIVAQWATALAESLETDLAREQRESNARMVGRW